MKTKYLLATLPLMLSVAISTSALARTNERVILPQASQTGGREVAAPPWSAACTTDQGPSQCGEPMWVYGSSGEVARYKNAF